MNNLSYLRPSSEKIDTFMVSQDSFDDIPSLELNRAVDWFVYEQACIIFQQKFKKNSAALCLKFGLTRSIISEFTPKIKDVQKRILILVQEKLKLLCFDSTVKLAPPNMSQDWSKINIPSGWIDHVKSPCIPRPMPQPENIGNSLYELYRDNLFADITLKTKTENISCHKAVLVARSEVYKKMFSAPMKEKQTNEINLSHCSANAVRLFLEYFYTDDVVKFSSELDVVLEVLDLANLHNLKKLKTLCSVALCHRISINTFLSIDDSARVYDLPSLTNFCITKLEIDSVLKEKVDLRLLGIFQRVVCKFYQRVLQKEDYNRKAKEFEEVAKDYHLPKTIEALENSKAMKADSDEGDALVKDYSLFGAIP